MAVLITFILIPLLLNLFYREDDLIIFLFDVTNHTPRPTPSV